MGHTVNPQPAPLSRTGLSARVVYSFHLFSSIQYTVLLSKNRRQHGAEESTVCWFQPIGGKAGYHYITNHRLPPHQWTRSKVQGLPWGGRRPQPTSCSSACHLPTKSLGRRGSGISTISHRAAKEDVRLGFVVMVRELANIKGTVGATPEAKLILETGFNSRASSFQVLQTRDQNGFPASLALEPLASVWSCEQPHQCQV